MVVGLRIAEGRRTDGGPGGLKKIAVAAWESKRHVYARFAAPSNARAFGMVRALGRRVAAGPVKPCASRPRGIRLRRLGAVPARRGFQRRERRRGVEVDHRVELVGDAR